jgi:HK97 gp10 family phage protein
MELKNKESLKTRLREMNVALDDVLEQVIEWAAKEVQAQAKWLSPVDTGELHNSIVTTTERAGNVITGLVTTNKEYAAYVEFGTGQRGSAYSGADKAPGITGYRADWPGMPAQPYLYPALKFKEKSINEKFVARCLAAIKRLAGGKT